MAVLYHFDRHPHPPEIQCFEKQSDWCGMWNYTWRIGTDEYGETCHCCMYKHLWINAPKEIIEFPDYTFEEHFGKLLPSYAPRSAIRDYLIGRYSKGNIKSHVKFNTPVRHVQYRENTDDFLVTVHDNKEDVTYSSVFTHVIVASGVFTVPNSPDFPGLETFDGIVLHSKYFRESKAFKGQRLLCIGASFSSQDIAIQCLKFGAKHIICSWNTQPMNLRFPKNIEERPPVVRFENKTAYFRDGTAADVDVVILCTGYKNGYAFLEENLRMKESIGLYPGNLYKGMVWMNGGNNRLFYIGTQNQFITIPMFEQQAVWIRKYIMKEFIDEPRDRTEMMDDIKIWTNRVANVGRRDGIDFKMDYIQDLVNMTGYHMQLDTIRDYLKLWFKHRQDDITTVRDQTFASTITGNMTPALNCPWVTIREDSLEYYLNSGKVD